MSGLNDFIFKVRVRRNDPRDIMQQIERASQPRPRAPRAPRASRMTGQQEMRHDRGVADAMRGVRKRERGKYYLLGYRFGLACRLRRRHGCRHFTQPGPEATMRVLMTKEEPAYSRLTFSDIAWVYPETPLVAEAIWERVQEERVS